MKITAKNINKKVEKYLKETPLKEVSKIDMQDWHSKARARAIKEIKEELQQIEKGK